MDIRKFGVLGGFVAGAALALAPMASADTTVDPGAAMWDQILDAEIKSMNSLFQSQAALTGVGADDFTKGSGVFADGQAGFDTITAADLTANPHFAQLLYGADWLDQMSSDPGSFSLFNGAVTQFTNSLNVGLYALLNNGELVSADDLFGGTGVINAALSIGGADTTWMEASGAFFNAGWDDVLGYMLLPGSDAFAVGWNDFLGDLALPWPAA